MLKAKLFSKLVSVMFLVMIGQMNSFSQSVNEKIDISAEFNKIGKYNEHISLANYYHHADQKRIGKNVSLFLGGLAGAIGAVVLLINDNFDIQLIGAAIGGVSIAVFVMAFEEKGAYNQQGEREALEKAKALFNTIPN